MNALTEPPVKRRKRTDRKAVGHTVSGAKTALIGPRDVDAFGFIASFQVIPSNFIHAHVGGNWTGFQKRLGDLYHETERQKDHYVDRPEEQYQYANSLYRHAIYKLGNKGYDVLDEAGHFVDQVDMLSRAPGEIANFAHSVMISTTLASIQLATKGTSVRFITWREMLRSPSMPEHTRKEPRPFKIKIKTTYKGASLDTEIEPDGVFGLEHTLRDGTRKYKFYFLEAERKNRVRTQKIAAHSSYEKKTVLYRELLDPERKLYKARWGLPNLRILTVTKTKARIATMKCAVSDIMQDRTKAFAFRDVPDLADPFKSPKPDPTLFNGPWDRVGKEPLYLDRSD